VLQQQGIEKSTCGKFVFKDGKVIVCFNENNEKNHGMVAITKDGKTEDQVTPESSVLQVSKHCSLVAQ
jgi:ribulose-5-phosphate 4-epimerase/fuculose-1-phosphate aldolase